MYRRNESFFGESKMPVSVKETRVMSCSYSFADYKNVYSTLMLIVHIWIIEQLISAGVIIGVGVFCKTKNGTRAVDFRLSPPLLYVGLRIRLRACDDGDVPHLCGTRIICLLCDDFTL